MATASGANNEAELKTLGELSDNDMPIVETLLVMGHIDRPNVDLALYRQHINVLHDALEVEIEKNPYQEDNLLEYRLARLNAVLRDQFHYGEDEEDFGDIDTINLLTVIDHRKGIPVALGALYMELATKQHWPIHGLNFPGHFLLRLDEGAHRLIFDPYHDGRVMDAGSMRKLLKETVDKDAELNHAYYETVTSRDVVLRFYNNKKTRLITESRYEEALDVTSRMMWIAPHEARLYFDSGILSAKISHVKDALDYLNKFIGLSTDKRSIGEAKEMIDNFRRQLQ